MSVYLSNAFSLNMLKVGSEGVHADINFVTPADIPADAINIIGHPDIATIVSSILERDIPVNRVTATLCAGDILYVVQYRGPRLPVGATTLPENAKLDFYRVALWIDGTHLAHRLHSANHR